MSFIFAHNQFAVTTEIEKSSFVSQLALFRNKSPGNISCQRVPHCYG